MNSNQYNENLNETCQAICNDDRSLAGTQLDAVKEQTQDCAQAWLIKAWTCETICESLECLERAVEINPNLDEAVSGLVWFNSVKDFAAQQLQMKSEQDRLAEEARLAEEERLAEEARAEEEARLAEEERLAEEARAEEEARLAEEEENRMAEEARIAEAARLAEVARLAAEEEENRLAEEAEDEKQVQIAAALEAARIADQSRIEEEARLATVEKERREKEKLEEEKLEEERLAAEQEVNVQEQQRAEAEAEDEKARLEAEAEQARLEALAQEENKSKDAEPCSTERCLAENCCKTDGCTSDCCGCCTSDCCSTESEEKVEVADVTKASVAASLFELASSTTIPAKPEGAKSDNGENVLATIDAMAAEVRLEIETPKESTCDTDALKAEETNCGSDCESDSPEPSCNLTESVSRKLIVLAVDDSPTVRKLVSLTLKREGFEVITADDGVEALQVLGETLPDIILTDINMPKLGGYKLCKFIKKHDRTKSIPVIMLSGKDGVFDKMRGKINGADDYMVKPFKTDELIAKVNQFLPTNA
jgi:CheY-like chemotaxis protein